MSAKKPTEINLEAGYVDPDTDKDDKQRSPILIPEVGIDNHTLTFYTSCDGCILRLLDVNDNIPFIAGDSGQLVLSRAANSIEVSVDVHDGNSWSIDVSNAITGEKVYNKKEIGSSHNINTDGWKSGIYIIKATNGKESLENKIAIK